MPSSWLLEELRIRHQRFGDTADNLEPDLKDGPGGLRDLNTLGWMALRAFGVRDLEALVGLGHLGADEAAALKRERAVLARLRFGLHRRAARKSACVSITRRPWPRAWLRRRCREPRRREDDAGLYRAALVVRRISDRLLQRFEEQFDGEAQPEPLTVGFSLRRGYLAANEADWPQGDIGQVFALFSSWANNPQVRGLHSLTARALAESLPLLPAYDQADADAREHFLPCCVASARSTRFRAWRGWACLASGFPRSPRSAGACSSTCSMSIRSTSTR